MIMNILETKYCKNHTKILSLFVMILLFQPSNIVRASEVTTEYNTEATTEAITETTTETQEYSLHFLDEEQKIAAIKVVSGGTIDYEALPSVPQKKGYTGFWVFEGVRIEQAIEHINQDLTLKLQWQPLNYHVTFHVNGGNPITPSKLKVTYDSPYGSFPQPTRRGYVFDGWYTKKTGGIRVQDSKLVALTKNSTFYARWSSVLPKTLDTMQTINYYTESITGLSNQKLPTSTIQSLLKPFGTYYGKGMPLSLYKKTMNHSWIDRTDYNNEPKDLTIDITRTMNYNTYVNYLKNLSRYEGVYLYEIGKSTDGRTLYSVEIDVDSSYDKKVICLTGQTHTREFAGGVYIVKQLYELIQKAQTDPSTMEMLKHYKFAAVPIISLDAREGMIANPKKWTTSGGELWKAYSNGTDGNRNYPGLQMGQIYKTYTKKPTISSKPGFSYYPGDYAGSCSETQAMMKWFYHYVIVEQAIYHVDYHQQGSIIYAGKPWQTTQQLNRCKELANGIASVLNKGNLRRYSYIPEDSSYGLRGEGSTASDFTVSLAVGAKFSPGYGFYVFPKKEKEYPLIQIRSLAQTRLTFKEANPNFAQATLEIGVGPQVLGNSSTARNALAKEYEKYNYSKMLEALPKFWEKR